MNKYWVGIVVLAGSSIAGLAQDTRKVVEPKYPAACVTLKAQLGTIGADDESKLDTERVQQAINSCGAGKAVELAADGAKGSFLIGPLELRTGVTLLVDKGVTLYGSRDPKVYENAAGTCGVVTVDNKKGCKPLIAVHDAPHAGVMGEGTIDGRGGSAILGTQKSWWDLANDARDNRHQQVPRMMDIDKSDDFTLYKITLKNSAMFHVVYHHGDGFTVWGLTIDTPKTARNTDGVDPSASKNITVTQSYIRTGDDNIAIKGGDGPVTDMSVVHNHFYYGHGMSIGSETNAGVSRILVEDLSLDGTESGIRIKSNQTRGGLVDGVTYRDVCIRDSNHPIQLETAYSYAGTKVDAFPVYKNILLQNVRISSSKTISMNGYDHDHRIGIRLDGVMLDDPSTYKFQVKHTDLLLGPGPVNFTVPGEDSTAGGKAGNGTLEGCASKLVKWPAK